MARVDALPEGAKEIFASLCYRRGVHHELLKKVTNLAPNRTPF